MRHLQALILPLAVSVAALAGCGGGSGDGEAGGSGGTPNMAITANAGPDQEAAEGMIVSVEGIGSGTTFSWAQLSGPAVTLSDAGQAAVSFEAPWIVEESAQIELELTVSEGAQSATDTLIVTVTNTPFVLFTVGGGQGEQADLYRAPFDGSTEPIKLSTTPTQGGIVPGFAGSPDGQYVAYLEGVDDGALFVVESGEGGSTTLIVPNVFIGFAFLAWSPDSTRIGYPRQEDPDVSDIFSSAPDGTENIKLSVGGGFSFKWSPDSSRIAYVGAQGLIGTTRDGSESVRLNSELVMGGGIRFYSWSPDSTRIAYAASQENADVIELFTAALDGGQNLKLNAPIEGGGVDRFAWSPDGTRIAYSIRPDGGGPHELRSVAADGTDDVKLSETLRFTSTFAWSPDSRRIAYIADEVNDLLIDVFELYSVAPDGSERVTVSGELVLLGDVWSLAWSPDGGRIAYIADQDTDEVFELYTSAADGSNNIKASGTLITGGDVLASFGLAWSPDGSRIVYVADQEFDEVRRIYSVAPDGGNNVSLVGVLPLGMVQQFRVN